MNIQITNITQAHILILKSERFNVTACNFQNGGWAMVRCDDGEVDEVYEFCADFDLEYKLS